MTGDNGTKNVEIMVALKYLSNFWRTLEMPLLNWNKYLSKPELLAQNPSLNHLV